MAILVRANLNDIAEYKGKNVSTKIGSKKHQVLFRLEVDDFSLLGAIEHAKNDKNVVMIDFAGTENFIKSCSIDTTGKIPYVGVRVEVGLNLTEEDIINLLNVYPEWVTLIIKLPDEYKDMQFLYEMCQKYSRLRFCGGHTFNIDGCRLGCCGLDMVEKLDIKVNNTNYIHQGCSCALESFDITDVELVVTQKAERNSNTGSSKSKSSTPKKPKAVFSDLLKRGAVDF